MSPAIGAIVVAVIALQSFWISHAFGAVGSRLDSLNSRVDMLDGRLESFRRESHTDMQAHTEAITDVRERITRLERT